MRHIRFFVVLFVIALSLGICAVAAVAQTAITDCGPITVAGPYVLANNLSATGDRLAVQSNSVTIDLGGFTITGPGAGLEGTGSWLTPPCLSKISLSAAV